MKGIGKLPTENDSPEEISQRRRAVIRVFPIVRMEEGKLMTIGKEKPTIIQVPEGTERIMQLQAKLRQYRSRYDMRESPSKQMDTICKIKVLEAMLKDSFCLTIELERELCQTYGSDFDHDAFDNACVVIRDYCATGGQMVKGGEGLPEIQ